MTFRSLQQRVSLRLQPRQSYASLRCLAGKTAAAGASTCLGRLCFWERKKKEFPFNLCRCFVNTTNNIKIKTDTKWDQFNSEWKMTDSFCSKLKLGTTFFLLSCLSCKPRMFPPWILRNYKRCKFKLSAIAKQREIRLTTGNYGSSNEIEQKLL